MEKETKEFNNAPKIRYPGFTDPWEQRELGEISNITIGEFVIRSKQNDSYPYPVYNGGTSNTGFYSDFNNEGEKILVSARGANAGFVNVVHQRYWAGNSCYSIGIKNPEKFLLEFVYQEMKRNQSRFTGNQQAANIPSVSKKDVEKFSLSIPEFDEQQQIGTLFQQLDDVITLHQKKIDLLQSYKKELLQKMFPKYETNIPDVRYPEFTDPWEQRQLGTIVQFLDNQRKPLEEAIREPGPYPYYGASGIVDYVKDYLFDEELILLSEDGANILDRNYPVCFIVKGKYWVNNHAHIMKPNLGIDHYFLSNCMERKDYSRYNTGMAMPKLNKEVCKRIPVEIPSFQEQQQIGAFFQQLDATITLHHRKLDLLKEYKKGLLQRMFI